jgi:hypothetical protein
VICWTRGSSRVKSRPGGFVNPGGEDSTMFHQQVPALKTTFPFGPSYTTAANDGGLLDRGVVEDLRAGDDTRLGSSRRGGPYIPSPPGPVSCPPPSCQCRRRASDRVPSPPSLRGRPRTSSSPSTGARRSCHRRRRVPRSGRRRDPACLPSRARSRSRRQPSCHSETPG